MKKYTFQDTKRIFGRNLKYYRYQNQLSQEKFAELTNTDITFISDIERGEVGVSFEKMTIFANTLNIPLYQLLKEEHLEEKLPRTIREYRTHKKNVNH